MLEYRFFLLHAIHDELLTAPKQGNTRHQRVGLVSFARNESALSFDSRFNTDGGIHHVRWPWFISSWRRCYSLLGLLAAYEARSCWCQVLSLHLRRRIAPIKTMRRKLRDRTGRAGKETKRKDEGRTRGETDVLSLDHITGIASLFHTRALFLSLHPLLVLVLSSHPLLLSFTAAAARLLLYGTENCGAVDSVFPLYARPAEFSQEGNTRVIVRARTLLSGRRSLERKT